MLIAERGASASIAVVSAAAHVLLGARDRDQPRLQLVSEGQRRVVLRSAIRQAETRRRSREPGQLRALQRAARHAAAHDGVLYRERRRRAAPRSSGARVHARRSLQAAARLSGDEPSLPHGSRPAAAARRQPRCRDSRSRALKALGINIVSQIDSIGRTGPDGAPARGVAAESRSRGRPRGRSGRRRRAIDTRRGARHFDFL